MGSCSPRRVGGSFIYMHVTSSNEDLGDAGDGDGERMGKVSNKEKNQKEIKGAYGCRVVLVWRQ